MRRRVCVILLALSCTLPLTACEKKQAQEVTAESVEEEEIGEEPEIPEEEESEEEVLEEAEAEEPEAYEEKVNVYGNSPQNIFADGICIYVPDGFFYIYNRGLGKTMAVQEKNGLAVSLHDKPLSCLNLWDDKLYGIEVEGSTAEGRIVRYDPKDRLMEVIREERASYLCLVDGLLYFTDAQDHSLRRMDLDGGGEMTLVPDDIYYPLVYKDYIYYQMNSDKESLYRVPIQGGEQEKLNDVTIYAPTIYGDRIYCSVKDGEQSTLRSMDLDGGNEVILAEGKVFEINLYEDKLLYLKEEEPDVIHCLDLSEENPADQPLDLSEEIKEVLQGISGEPILEYAVKYFERLNVSGDYLMFYTCDIVDGLEYYDQYLYQMQTGEMRYVPIFCQSMDWMIEALFNQDSDEGEAAQEPAEGSI